MVINETVWAQSLRVQRIWYHKICASRQHEPLLQLRLIPQPIYGRDTQEYILNKYPVSSQGVGSGTLVPLRFS